MSGSEITEDDLVEYLPLQQEIIVAETIEIFNEKPNDARLFLIEKRLITGSAEEFAHFIFLHPKLSKRRVGEYVGKDDPFNQEVCEHLFAKYDLGGLMVDEAIRYLARQLRLPGEAQQIDRILEKFANSYFAHNPKFSLSAETLYILFFSLIMLNTDLHNPSVAKHKKMKLEQFISNLRGINNGKDISRELLTSLYRRIKKHPIRMNDEDMYERKTKEFIAPTKSGWLEKECSNIFGAFKRRWFILKDGCLYYFTAPFDDHPRAVVPMLGLRVELRTTEKECPPPRIERKSSRVMKPNEVVKEITIDMKKYYSYIVIGNEDPSQPFRMGKFLQPRKTTTSAAATNSTQGGGMVSRKDSDLKKKPIPSAYSVSNGGMQVCYRQMLLLRCPHDEASSWYDLLYEECHLLNEALRIQREAKELMRMQLLEQQQPAVVCADVGPGDELEEDGLIGNIRPSQFTMMMRNTSDKHLSTIHEECSEAGDMSSPVDGTMTGRRFSKNSDIAAAANGATGAYTRPFTIPENGGVVDLNTIDISGIDHVECDDDSIGDSVDHDVTIQLDSPVEGPAGALGQVSEESAVPARTQPTHTQSTMTVDSVTDTRSESPFSVPVRIANNSSTRKKPVAAAGLRLNIAQAQEDQQPQQERATITSRPSPHLRSPHFRSSSFSAGSSSRPTSGKLTFTNSKYGNLVVIGGTSNNSPVLRRPSASAASEKTSTGSSIVVTEEAAAGGSPRGGTSGKMQKAKSSLFEKSSSFNPTRTVTVDYSIPGGGRSSFARPSLTSRSVDVNDTFTSNRVAAATVASGIRRDSKVEGMATTGIGIDASSESTGPIEPGIIGLLRILNCHQAHASTPSTRAPAPTLGASGVNDQSLGGVIASSNKDAKSFSQRTPFEQTKLPADLSSISQQQFPAPGMGLSVMSQDISIAGDRFVDISATLVLDAPMIQGWLLLESSNVRRNSDVGMMSNKSQPSPVGYNFESLTNNSPVIPRRAEKYFALYENADGEGPTLFWYANEEAAKVMQFEGIQTQQRYVRIKNLQSVNYIDPSVESVTLQQQQPSPIVVNSALQADTSRFSTDENGNQESTESPPLGCAVVGVLKGVSTSMDSDTAAAADSKDVESDGGASRKVVVSAFDNPVDYRSPVSDHNHDHNHFHQSHQLSNNSSPMGPSSMRPPLPQPRSRSVTSNTPGGGGVSSNQTPFSPFISPSSSTSASDKSRHLMSPPFSLKMPSSDPIAKEVEEGKGVDPLHPNPAANSIAFMLTPMSPVTPVDASQQQLQQLMKEQQQQQLHQLLQSQPRIELKTVDASTFCLYVPVQQHFPAKSMAAGSRPPAGASSPMLLDNLEEWYRTLADTFDSCRL